MKRTFAVFLIGFLLALAGYIPFYKHVREKWYNLGRNAGNIEGLSTAVKSLKKEFGTYDGKSDYRTLFSVKCESVIVIEKDGKKQIKIY